jgi:NAD(P)-dependent dehydrogenase (short-subunit alcohol dehydrogenase family)
MAEQVETQVETIVITGAGSGIGRATAVRLAQRMQVVVADRNADAARAVAAELVQKGRQALAVEVDVTRRESVADMVRQVERNVGPVHALFSNAGINRRAPVEAITEADWDLMMQTHVKGAFLCAQAVLPGMQERRRGAILMMSSDYAVLGMPGAAAYAAAKTAVYSLAKSLALAFAADGIRVNALGPGPIDTPLLRAGRTAQEWDHVQQNYVERLPMHRLGRPEEVAAVADFLLSDRASYITGQILHPNGGQLTW